MSKSCAEIATGEQGWKAYIGHDTYQNGIIDSSCNRVYMAGWQNDWACATLTDENGVEQLSASGYFTDQATIDRCMHDGRLNTNELDAALQTKLSACLPDGPPVCLTAVRQADRQAYRQAGSQDVSTSSGKDGNKIQGDFQAHSHVSAYDIDHGRLAELQTENPELYDRLTNPDGLSPEGGGIKAAYGKSEANPQHGAGGGNRECFGIITFTGISLK